MKNKILETVPVRWKGRVNPLTTCSCGEENKETTGLVRLNLPKVMLINVVVLVREYFKKTENGR